MKKLFAPLYVLSLFSFTIFSYLFIDSNFEYLSFLHTGFNWTHHKLTALMYLILISLFFGFYILFLKNLKLFSEKEIFKKKFFLLIPLLAYPSMLSYDIFNYIATAKTVFFYQENPYIVMPIEFLGDPMLNFTQATNKLALYGPAWILISGIPFFLSFGNYLASIFLFRLFMGFFYVGTVYLIWKISRNLLSVVLFALSPLVIIETFISGHNDIAMMFFALLSIHFLKNRKVLLSLIFLLASILIKYATIFLLPVFIYLLIKILKNQKINWEKIYFYSFVSMLLVSLLGIFREEIYPWYAIWPLSFLVLSKSSKIIVYTFIALTFGLMLSYAPYMYFGTYFGFSKFLRVISIFTPPALTILYLLFQNKRNGFSFK